jgi:hypothetical protein
MASSTATYVVSTTARLAAPPDRVYATIANYHTGHPQIVPKQFSGLTVEEGGIGEGTRIRFQVRVFGTTTHFRALVSEPEPGRVLVERNIAGSDSVTTFTVDPGPVPGECTVTISTELSLKSGLGGRIERLLTARILRPMYAEELRRLETQARASDPARTAAPATARASHRPLA